MVYILSQYKKSNTSDQTGLSIKPNIPNTYNESYKITLSLPEGDFEFPNDLPLLKNTPLKTMTFEEAKKIAANFGYTTEPKTANDIEEGTTYIWTGANGNLLIYSKTRRTSYSSSKGLDAINKQLSDDAMIQLGSDFAASHFGIDNQKIQFSGFVFYNALPNKGELTLANRPNANIYQINYTVAQTDYPLLTLNPANTVLYVRLLKDGSVNSAIYTDLSGLEKSQEEFKLKNFKQLQDTLSEAVIVTLDNGNINPGQIKQGDITSIEINKISLAYLMDSRTSTSFAPVYLLEGSAQIKSLTQNISAQLYLPAITDN